MSAWTNLADGEDVVAVMGALDAAFGPSDARVELVDRRLVNECRRPDGEADHHKCYGYLRTAEFSRIARGSPTAAGGIERSRRRAPRRDRAETTGNAVPRRTTPVPWRKRPSQA